MKLNHTYPLHDILNAVAEASENTKAVANRMKKENKHMTVFTVYETEGMLSTSEYARVTLTRKSSTISDRWEGYMETSIYRDGKKTPVAVQKKEYVMVANDDFSKFEVQI